MNEQDVREVLVDLARTPAPPSQVDVERAVVVARRRARARAWAPAAASILIVCGVAAGVTYAVTNIDRSPPASPSPATSAAPMIEAPQRFDPLVRYASFGWLPEQPTLGRRNMAVTTEQFTMSAAEYVPDPANGPGAALPAALVNVRLYAAGVVPQTEQPVQAWTPTGTQTVHYGPVTDAPPVNGAPAYWVGSPGGGTETIILKWRYAPNAWAELSLSKLTGDPRQTAHRIASSLRIGGTERLRFPFQLTGLPTGVTPTGSQFEEGGPQWPWHATLDLNAQADGQGPSVQVVAHPNPDTRGATTTVDGHPARRETFEGDHLGVPQYSDRLHVFGLDGLQASIFIDATTAAHAAAFGPDGVAGIFRALTLYADPTTWTDQPLR